MFFKMCIIYFLLENTPSIVNTSKRHHLSRFYEKQQGFLKKTRLRQDNTSITEPTEPITPNANVAGIMDYDKNDTEYLEHNIVTELTPMTPNADVTEILEYNNNATENLEHDQDGLTTTTEQLIPVDANITVDPNEALGPTQFDQYIDDPTNNVTEETTTITTTTSPTTTKIHNEKSINNDPQFGSEEVEVVVEEVTEPTTKATTQRTIPTTTLQVPSAVVKAKPSPHIFYTLQKVYCFTHTGGYFLLHVLKCLHDQVSLAKLKFTAKVLLNNDPEKEHISFYRCIGRVKITSEVVKNKFALKNCFHKYNLEDMWLEHVKVVNDFIAKRLKMTRRQLEDFSSFMNCLKEVAARYTYQKVNDCIDINPILVVAVEHYNNFLEEIKKSHKKP